MKRVVLSGMVLATVLCGCTGGEHGREPENTVLVQVLGVDWMDGVYRLTAAGTNGKGETVIHTVAGESLQQAFTEMPGSGEAWISVKNVAHILLGDRVDPEKVLSFVLDNGEISWRAFVWYAPVSETVMKEEKDGGRNRLTVIKEAGVQTASVLDVLVGLKENGEIGIPALTRKNGRLEDSGFLCYEMRRGR